MLLKSQISVEYMFIIGFATLVSIPLLVIYYTYSSEASDSVSTSQAMQIARKIVDASESVYYIGKPSQTTLKMNFPENLQVINLSNYEIVIKVKTKNGVTDVVQISSVNISGNLSRTPGIHIVTIKAEDKFVNVTSN